MQQKTSIMTRNTILIGVAFLHKQVSMSTIIRVSEDAGSAEEKPTSVSNRNRKELASEARSFVLGSSLNNKKQIGKRADFFVERGKHCTHFLCIYIYIHIIFYNNIGSQILRNIKYLNFQPLQQACIGIQMKERLNDYQRSLVLTNILNLKAAILPTQWQKTQGNFIAKTQWHSVYRLCCIFALIKFLSLTISGMQSCYWQLHLRQ